MKISLIRFALLGTLVAISACDTKYAMDCSNNTASVVHISQPSYKNCTPEQIAALEKQEDENLDSAAHSLDSYAKEGPVSRAEVPGSGSARVDSAADDYLRSESSSVH